MFILFTFSPAALDTPTGFPLESNTWIPVSDSSLLTVDTLKKARAAEHVGTQIHIYYYWILLMTYCSITVKTKCFNSLPESGIGSMDLKKVWIGGLLMLSRLMKICGRA